VQATVKAGEVPKFRLTIRNAGEAPERIIDLSGGRRGDLQDTYYDLEVKQSGKRVEIPRAISDPGPISKADFLDLKPGEDVTFEFTRFAAALQSLPPGEYRARIRVVPHPYHSAASALYSPYAQFKVRR
jgi:hypothetical protein